MGFVYEEKPSTSPFVDSIWRTEDTADGTYLAAADGAWDLVFTEREGTYSILLSGPSSHATAIKYQAGNRNFGVRFRQGAFIPTTSSMIDVTNALPQKSKKSFWLQGESWELPTFDNIDEFLTKLARRRLLTADIVVSSVLAGQQPALTDRTIQRHFIHAIGLTPQYMKNIARANNAVSLLQQGGNIADVATQLGYSDQAHMTRQVKHVSGRTPGQIARAVEACRLRSIPGYGPCAQMRVQNCKQGLDHGYQTVQNQYPGQPARRAAGSA